MTPQIAGIAGVAGVAAGRGGAWLPPGRAAGSAPPPPRRSERIWYRRDRRGSMARHDPRRPQPVPIAPGDPLRRPFYVRFALSGIDRRPTARRLVWVSLGFAVVAALLQDPTLLGIALLGAAMYGAAIRWMDRHGAWATEDAGEDRYGAATPASPASDPAPSAAPAAPPVPTTPSRAAAVLAAIGGVLLLVALAALESHGGRLAGAHLVAVVFDALFGIGFGLAGVGVALRRPRIPYERAATLMTSAGLGLVGSLGFLIASDGASLTGDGLGLGPAAALTTLLTASAAGLWLTGTSGGRFGWLAAVPTVAFGWYLGLAAWIAHIQSA